ncbi:hypothetical protein [Bacteriovorax sp. Seq25_V]|uniref:hypothetical protein n=1 Tax=Bacteriovorax sp. Seq25_V TaxID=1201288 RepID=UPI00038A0C40|nr:hypothetical protein [Bacteriovorax sp. Seq25_V]EQC45250.1 hypothetical protein M900_2199 [Bacteriovorax sp. Seq25_V]
MNSKTQFKWFILFLGVAYTNYLAYDNFFRPEIQGHWSSKSSQTVSDRAPASLDLSTLPAASQFEDYFQFDTHSGHVTYDMDVHFWSDKGADYFKKNGKEAIEEGLKKTFAELAKGNKELTLPASAKGQLVKQFLNQFVYTFKAVKLIDANFELDFTFTPRNTEASFSPELDSNQLVNFNTTGRLLNDITNDPKTLPESVLGTNIPFSGEAFQYVGGAITVSAELLDTSWKITQPIPKPTKNAVKGFLRLRKYYRVNDPSVIDLNSVIKNKSINVSMTHFKLEDDYKHQYITVDNIYSFNLADLIPQPEKMVIHVGEIVSLDKSHDNLIKRIFSIFKKDNDIRTSDLYISGESNFDMPSEKFKTRVEKLVYDMKEKKFTSNSKIVTRSTNSSSDFKINNKIKRAFLEAPADKIIESFKLEELFNSIK